eukprot:CAMPEP_0194703428 /NCGR_PEP_ID=MMETSP0295-20121207/27576_1 /TAXON_ID=39354 /ORGANISM="Heterosigma akashiwo, Strain CCMP2393" /LENGTH=217 /DNA_ID=CAMNT_0039598409 /DNA_START=78 /DNA_END=727 /DNA_ORIENTATION=+
MSQYLLFYLKRRAIIGGSATLVGPQDKKLLQAALFIAVVNAFLYIYGLIKLRVYVVQKNNGENCCDFDSSTKLLLDIYSLFDILYGMLFVFLFLSPIAMQSGLRLNARGWVLYIIPFLRRTKSSSSHQLAPAEIMIRNQQTANNRALKRVFQANFQGAMISQIAQTASIVCVAALHQSKHADLVPILVLANAFGISVMFQDVNKTMRAVNGAMRGWT